MLFNSLQFLLFFPIVTVLYFLLPHKFRWIHLLIASCIFYIAFIPVYILILFFTILIDYAAGIFIENSTQGKRKLFLVMSLVANIGVLAVFKYYNFFIENINEMLHAASVSTHNLPLLNIILPIGLSFHTFQAMSYTIEVYRGHQKAERHLGIYALYVMFYPQLVAGPIERPQNLLHQFKEKHYYSHQQLLDGLRLMLWGFFKKVVIADRLSLYVNPVFNHPEHYHYLNLIIATLFFTIQIYCDFSGYSDIAIGAAKTMGFHLMTNFNRPYFSKNIQEFWKRWHISLSTWFKDYLYISMGGNRVSINRMYLNIAVVFVVSGFWHGANWTYIIWGSLHAVFIVSYLIYRNNIKRPSQNSKLYNFISILFTFMVVSFAWIFFRANTFADALLIVKHIFSGYQGQGFQMILKGSLVNEIVFTNANYLVAVLMMMIMMIVEIKISPNLLSLNKKPFSDLVFCTSILSLIILFGVFQSSSFIYFQF